MTSLCAMDTSDGLADAIYKISEASNCTLEINGNNLPISKEFLEKCDEFDLDYKKTLLYGAEDFSLVVTLNPEYARILNIPEFSIIGKVVANSNTRNSIVKFGCDVFEINESSIRENTYKHFS